MGYTLWTGTVGFASPLGERFAAAVATGCRQATLSPPDVLRAATDAISTASSDLPVQELAGPFGRLCDRAAGFGARVHLEFMPFTRAPRDGTDQGHRGGGARGWLTGHLAR